MPRKRTSYVRTGHRTGPKPGRNRQPEEAAKCRCGEDAIRMGGDECAKCGKRLADA